MILIDVREYLKEKSTCNLQELSLHFHRDPAVMRDILSHWIRKGVIALGEKPVGCGIKCVQCKPSVAQVYHYVARSQ